MIAVKVNLKNGSPYYEVESIEFFQASTLVFLMASVASCIAYPIDSFSKLAKLNLESLIIFGLFTSGDLPSLISSSSI